MTSDLTSPDKAYVWIWLPGETKPVIAGLLTYDRGQLVFNYGQSYLARKNAIAIYDQELPLKSGILPLIPGLSMPGCLRDAAPDAWGRRVILNRRFGRQGRDVDPEEISELSYLLESGSDRIGALDFQASSENYKPRETKAASLEDLQDAAARVEQGIPIHPELDQALFHGSSLGGARPKAMIEDNGTKYIAKFSSQNDLTNVVKAEFIAMRLAERVGLDVAKVRLERAAHKDILLIERFDRVPTKGGQARKAMVSALTLLELDEMMARYASYEKLCEIIRHRFDQPKAVLRELYGRLVFNILCGNTDDHARNHAAFWDGQTLRLTPAYDICPQHRAGNEASQAMLIKGNDRMSRLSTCLDAAVNFLLKPDEAEAIIRQQIFIITENWRNVCDEAGLSEIDRNGLWRRQFINPFAIDGVPHAWLAPLS